MIFTFEIAIIGGTIKNPEMIEKLAIPFNFY